MKRQLYSRPIPPRAHASQEVDPVDASRYVKAFNWAYRVGSLIMESRGREEGEKILKRLLYDLRGEDLPGRFRDVLMQEGCWARGDRCPPIHLGGGPLRRSFLLHEVRNNRGLHECTRSLLWRW